MMTSDTITEYLAQATTLESYAERVTQLNGIKQLLIDNQTSLLQALHTDLGKAEQEAWTTEIGYTLSEIKHTLGHLKRWMRVRKVSTPLLAQPAKSYILPQPLGCILIIGAWNYPLQLTIGPLIAAIAAGNSAVVKPSELAPATSALLARLIPQYVSSRSVKVIEGGAAETTELLRHKFDHIMYTGGEMVGKIVMTAAAQYLTPVTLELGGKCPCVIDSSADLALASKRIAWGKWTNAGQTCVAPDYLIVEQNTLPALISALKKTLSDFYPHGTRQHADYGKVVNQKHHQRLLSYLSGQDVVIGGDHDQHNLYLAPTVVINPSPDSALMQQEIFGPILPIVTVEHIQQASQLVNRKPKPLALYVFTQDQNFAQSLTQTTQSGNVCINDCMIFLANPNLPFGGVGNSGMGQYHGQAGFDNFSHLKSVMHRSTWLDPVLRYPPFSRVKLNLLKKLF